MQWRTHDQMDKFMHGSSCWTIRQAPHSYARASPTFGGNTCLLGGVDTAKDPPIFKLPLFCVRDHPHKTSFPQVPDVVISFLPAFSERVKCLRDITAP